MANALLGAVSAAALASELASRDASIAGLQASKADASALTAYALLSAVDGLPALHGGRAGHSTGGGHQDSKCPAGSRHQAFVAAQLANASITALQGAKADTTLLASYATNAALSARPRSRAPSTQSSRSSPPCSFPEAELLTRRPGRASRLGSSLQKQRRSQPASGGSSLCCAGQRQGHAEHHGRLPLRRSGGRGRGCPARRRPVPFPPRCWPTTPRRKWTRCWETTAQARRTRRRRPPSQARC